MNLTQIQFLISLLLPLPIVLVAGILRQDKFPPIVNEVLAWGVTFLAALLSVAFGIGGHLTGNVQLDFVAVVSYAGLLAHSSMLKPIQTYLQSNLLSLGMAEASKVEQATIADVMSAVNRLNAFFEGASVAPQAGQGQTPVQTQSSLASGTVQIDFPNQSIPYAPSGTFPMAAIMPQPPKG